MQIGAAGSLCAPGDGNCNLKLFLLAFPCRLQPGLDCCGHQPVAGWVQVLEQTSAWA